MFLGWEVQDLYSLFCVKDSLQFCVSYLSQKLNTGAMCGSLVQLRGCFMYVFFSSSSNTVVPPAGGVTHECTRVYFILLTWTLFITFTTGTRKLARGSVNISGFNVYTELLFCREIYSTCILVKLHVQKKKLGAAQAHHNFSLFSIYCAVDIAPHLMSPSLWLVPMLE